MANVAAGKTLQRMSKNQMGWRIEELYLLNDPGKH